MHPERGANPLLQISACEKSGFLRGGGLGEGPSFSGADCLTHGEKNKADVDKYGKQAMEKTILDAISVTDVGPEAE